MMKRKKKMLLLLDEIRPEPLMSRRDVLILRLLFTPILQHKDMPITVQSITITTIINNIVHAMPYVNSHEKPPKSHLFTATHVQKHVNPGLRSLCYSAIFCLSATLCYSLIPCLLGLACLPRGMDVELRLYRVYVLSITGIRPHPEHIQPIRPNIKTMTIDQDQRTRNGPGGPGTLEDRRRTKEGERRHGSCPEEYASSKHNCQGRKTRNCWGLGPAV